MDFQKEIEDKSREILLKTWSSKTILPIIFFGDFNDMLFASDKSGQHLHSQAFLEEFKATIDDCRLIELDLKGGEFTWEKSKKTENWVRERLDRAFANNSWWRKFPLYKLLVTHIIKSDHDPIILEPVNVEFSRKQFIFKFENTWLHEKSFKEEVTKVWKEIPEVQLLPKLICVSSFTAKWGRNFFHKVRDKVKKQKQVIEGLFNRSDEERVRLYFEERNNLNDLLIHEELYWKQRTNAFRLTDGDTNSKFFHTVASKRRKLNHITHIYNDHDDLVANQKDMCSVVLEYFRGVFEDGGGGLNQVVENGGRVVNEDQDMKLTAEINFVKFTAAIKQMHLDKSAGHDGEEIFRCCETWLAECSFPERINDTTLVLF